MAKIGMLFTSQESGVDWFPKRCSE